MPCQKREGSGRAEVSAFFLCCIVCGCERKGKKEKLNKVDIVGFLIQKGELYKEDIGMIDIKDHYSYVAINRKKINRTLRLIRKEKIKNNHKKGEYSNEKF